jgi:hypothetical protein
MRITHGSSTDHRPELRVSQDGGVPLVSKSGDGHASERRCSRQAEALVRACASSPTPRYLVADAKRYTEDTAATLAKLGFITRMPGTLTLGSQVIPQALQWDLWHHLDETTRYHRIALGHYGVLLQVVASHALRRRV